MVFKNSKKPDKSNLLLISKEESSIKIEGCIINTSTSRKLLAVIIDNKPNCYEHVSKLCTKASQKLHEKHNMRNTFLEKSYTKHGGETIPRPFPRKSKLSISLDQ